MSISTVNMMNGMAAVRERKFWAMGVWHYPCGGIRAGPDENHGRRCHHRMAYTLRYILDTKT